MNENPCSNYEEGHVLLNMGFNLTIPKKINLGMFACNIRERVVAQTDHFVDTFDCVNIVCGYV